MTRLTVRRGMAATLAVLTGFVASVLSAAPAGPIPCGSTSGT